MLNHPGFFLHIFSRHFLSFSSYNQRIAVIITPTSKLQKEFFRGILKKRFPKTQGESPSKCLSQSSLLSKNVTSKPAVFCYKHLSPQNHFWSTFMTKACIATLRDNFFRTDIIVESLTFWNDCYHLSMYLLEDLIN